MHEYFYTEYLNIFYLNNILNAGLFTCNGAFLKFDISAFI